jgi:hypothetical protein
VTRALVAQEVDQMHPFVMALAVRVLAAPNPGSTAPPGSGTVLTVLSWLGWLASAAGVAGLLAVGISMMMSHKRGDTGQHGAAFAWVIAGCILAAAAGPIATAAGV